MALTGNYQVRTEFSTRDIPTNTNQGKEEGGRDSRRIGRNRDTEFLHTPVYFHILMHCLTRRYGISSLWIRSWSKAVGALRSDIKWLPATVHKVYTSPTFPADDLSLRKVVVNLSKETKIGAQSVATLGILNDAVFEETQPSNAIQLWR
ncbi:hypothetical protein N7478_007908 [Penicillium angulare]|uniref:uncharacterized protein n=1 Tax=Penicillium angulare TaxID=116970 RepID=UPI00253FC024|nr:uncharacterized protein N7478_007908 [Penicillium angulare]KAJ5272783.1 hypothetical protein N7478_007908 [Penicillium angulare]